MSQAWTLLSLCTPPDPAIWRQVRDQFSAQSPSLTSLKDRILFEAVRRVVVECADPSVAHIWNNYLHRASEAVSLEYSQERSCPSSLARKLTPEVVGSGWNGTFFVQSLMPETISDALEASRTALYKPRHLGVGGRDGGVIYTNRQDSERYKIRPSRDGESLELENMHNGNVVRMQNSALELANPPPKIRIGDRVLTLLSRLRKGVDVGNECIHERLFSVFGRYVDEIIASMDSFPVSSLGIPDTSIEDYKHPLFGAHHTVGSRHEFIDNTLAVDLISAVTETARIPAKYIQAIPFDEFCKVAFTQIATANLDCNAGNLLVQGLFQREARIIQIDGAYTFPSLSGGDEGEWCAHTWMKFPQTEQPFSQPWVQLIQATCANQLIHAFEEDLSILCSRFPAENFSFSEQNKQVLHASIELLRNGVEQGWSMRQIAQAQARPYLAGKDGPTPGSFWTELRDLSSQA